MLPPHDPPPTSFYAIAGNAAMWRELAHLKAEYSGGDAVKRQEFDRLLRDFLLRDDPLACFICCSPVENIADSHFRHLQCPDCGWEPVTVRALEGTEKEAVLAASGMNIP